MENKKRKGWKIALAAILGVLVLAVGAFLLYTSAYYPPSGPALDAVAAAAPALTETGGYTAYGDPAAQTGYVFYPGGKVDSSAYLPYLMVVAEEGGVFCAVLKPPFRLAMLGGSAAEVMADYPGVQRWFVGGHSLGGVAAASFAEKNPVAGLVLLAAYPVANLSKTNIPVLSVAGTEDGVLNWGKYEEARALLPPGTEYLLIEGGNHAQMGDYGPQKGDGAASISPAQQEEAVIQATLAFIR